MKPIPPTARRVSLCLATLVAALLAPRPAHAEEPPTLRGLEADAGLGTLLFVAGSQRPWIGGIPLVADAHLGFRVTRRTAFGVHLRGAFFGDAQFVGHSDGATALSAGLYLRVHVAPHPERPGWDPWLGFELDVISRVFASGVSTYPGRADIAVDQEGRAFTLSLRLGLDRRMNDHLAIGGSLTTSFWMQNDICETRASSTETYRNCFREVHDFDYAPQPSAALSVALTLHARYTLPL
jgi:hypothetical protein